MATNAKIYWRITDQAVTELARDTVQVNVEERVWPFPDKNPAGWNLQPTKDWIGVAVQDTWGHSKRLIDYIIFPATQGTISTYNPRTQVNVAGKGMTPAAKKVQQDSFELSSKTESYPNGFKMWLDYEFEKRSMPNGYVQALKADDTPTNKKLSFVGNVESNLA